MTALTLKTSYHVMQVKPFIFIFHLLCKIKYDCSFYNAEEKIAISLRDMNHM